MKISRRWITDYLDFELPPNEELLKVIGAQLGAIETVTDLTACYRGLVVVRVVSCESIVDSDHLHICQIDDNGKTLGVERNEPGLVQVVCGAPNVRAGLLAVWLPPGTTVPASFDHEPFILEARKLRGFISNGMLASPKELAIGDSHGGILELDDIQLQPGADFADSFGLNDTIIDIENKMFTHRPDCFGQLGVAREIAGILGSPFHSPEWYMAQPSESAAVTNNLPLNVRNELPELVPRFVAVAIEGVDGSAVSPVWLQTYLSRVGIRPISLIVDITNYMMLLSAQPLHAYDYDKVRAQDNGADQATLVVRHPHENESLQLLNGKDLHVWSEAMIIATESKPIGLGGIMGGANTEVDATTKNIILEAATFDMFTIRRTAMEHGIFSDAVTRFSKGQSPLQNKRVLLEAIRLLLELSKEARVASSIVDDQHLGADQLSADSLLPPVTLSADFINDRLGLQIPTAEMTRLLENVEFKVSSQDEMLTIKPPFWRSDIDQAEDVVEEIGRLYGFDKVPLRLPKRDLTPAPADPMLTLKAKVRTTLSRAGANEVLTYSFVHGALLDKAGQDAGLAFRLSNALSPDLQYYRQSLLPSLLDKVHLNIKAGYDEFALFELGKSHSLLHQGDGEDNLPQEFDVAALVYASSERTHKPGAAFYEARKFLIDLTASAGQRLTLKPCPTEMPDVPMVKPFNLARSACVYTADGDEFLGIIGEFTDSAQRQLKLPQRSSGFEIDLGTLLKAQPTTDRYTTLPRYPAVTQDICFRLPDMVTYQQLFDFVWTKLAEYAPAHSYSNLGPVDIYRPQEAEAPRQITLRIKLSSHDKTLTEAEVSQLLDKLTDAAGQELKVERV